MSHLPLNKKNDIISKSNKGFLYAGRFNKQSLSGIEFDSNRVSQRARCIRLCCLSMENTRDTKRQKKNYGAYAQITRKREDVKNNSRLSQNYRKINYKFRNLNKYFTILNYLSFLLTNLNYNPIMLNGMKGFKIQIDLRKTATVDDIINLEQKILGIRGILDAFGTSIDLGLENPQEALALVRDTITHTIIQKDINELKDKIEYMFGVCASIYHDGEVA